MATMDKVEPDDKVKPEILEFLYDHVREAPELQVANGRDLDSKMVWVFGAATVVIGLAGFSATAEVDGDDGVTALLIAGLISYCVVALLAFAELWPRPFWRSLHPDSLWENYWQDSPEDTKHALLADIVGNYKRNRSLLDQKALAIQGALLATAVETICVGAALILVRV